MTLVDGATPKLPIKRIIPGFAEADVPHVPVVYKRSQIGTADGPSVCHHRSSLPAAVGVARVPGLHDPESRRGNEAAQRFGHLFARARKLGPTRRSAAYGVEPQDARCLETQTVGEVDVGLQLEPVLPSEDQERQHVQVSGSRRPDARQSAIEASL